MTPTPLAILIRWSVPVMLTLLWLVAMVVAVSLCSAASDDAPLSGHREIPIAKPCLRRQRVVRRRR